MHDIDIQGFSSIPLISANEIYLAKSTRTVLNIHISMFVIIF